MAWAFSIALDSRGKGIIAILDLTGALWCVLKSSQVTATAKNCCETQNTPLVRHCCHLRSPSRFVTRDSGVTLEAPVTPITGQIGWSSVRTRSVALTFSFPSSQFPSHQRLRNLVQGLVPVVLDDEQGDHVSVPPTLIPPPPQPSKPLSLSR